MAIAGFPNSWNKAAVLTGLTMLIGGAEASRADAAITTAQCEFSKTACLFKHSSHIAGFPKLFPVVLAKGDPPPPDKYSKKPVSPSKPTDKPTHKEHNSGDH